MGLDRDVAGRGLVLSAPVVLFRVVALFLSVTTRCDTSWRTGSKQD